MIRYLYDGSFEGLMNVLHETYYGDMPDAVEVQTQMQHSMLFENKVIETDLKIYEKVCSTIENKLSSHILQLVYKAYLSGNRALDLSIIKYIRKAFKFGVSIEHNLSDGDILIVNKYARRVGFEALRLKGFIRFREVDQILFSKIQPEYDVLGLLSDHFVQRLPYENWIIWDANRSKLLINQKKGIEIVEVNNIDIENLYEGKLDDYEKLWKLYFENIGVEGRLNLKTQKSYMPKRYWANLIEMKDK